MSEPAKKAPESGGGGPPLALWVVLGLAAVLVAVLLWRKSHRSEIIYREIHAHRGDLAVTILSTGVVQPENRLEIKPPINGRADEVLVQEGDQVKKGQILIWMSSTERASLIDAARARGEQEVRAWEQLYKASPVIAPVDGTIIQRNIQPGQVFTTSDAVLVMSDRLTVQAQVDETDIAQIRNRQEAQIVLDAYPDQTIPAAVDRIAYDAKTVNNVTTYVVDVLPKQVPAFMRSGMTANVTFDVDNRPGVILVPSEAIKKHPDSSSYVLVPAASGGATEERAVKTGATDGKRIEVVSGLQENDAVLLPQLKLGGKGGGSNPFGPPGAKKH